MTFPAQDRISAARAPRQPVPSRSDMVVTLLQILVVVHFSVAYIDGTTSWISLPKYVAGTERLPFQFRALTAWTMQAAVHLPGIAMLAHHASKKMADPLMITWAGLVMLSTVWILHSARQAAATIFKDPLLTKILALTFMIPLYIDYEALANGYRLSYAYDLPSLALFNACVVAILRGLRLRMLVLFALATLSRETSVYLIPIFLLYAWIDARGCLKPRFLPDLPWAAAMVVIWILTKRGLVILYGGNPLESHTGHLPGPVPGMEFQLYPNLAALINPLQWPDLLSPVGWLWLPVFGFWRGVDDKRLRIAIAVGTPAVAVIMLFVGRIAEPRVFGELTIFYWLAALTLVRGMWRTLPTQGPSLADTNP